jgi:rhodanese-related sulfurtransferase
MTPIQIKRWLDDAARDGTPAPVMVDVREAHELEICALPTARAIPMRSIPERLSELDPSAPTVVICHHGMRSAQVGLFLEHHGFTDIINLQGGVAAWAAQVDPTMPTY